MATKKKTTTKRRNTKKEQQQKAELKQWITIVLIVAVTIFSYGKMGPVGIFLDSLQQFLFGNFYYIIMILIVAQIIVTIINHRSGFEFKKNPMAMILLIVAVLLLSSYLDTSKDLSGFKILTDFTSNNLTSGFSFQKFITLDWFNQPMVDVGGGLFGAILLSISTEFVEWTGSVIVIAVLFIISALLLVNLEVYKNAFKSVKNYLSTADEYEEEDEEEETTSEPVVVEAEVVPSSPKQMTINFDELQHDENDTGKITQPLKPESRLDIRVDDDSSYHEEEPVQDTTDPSETRAIFINVDDLLEKESEPEMVEETEEIEEEPTELLENEITPVQEETTSSTVEAPVTPGMPKMPKKYVLPKVSLLDEVPKKTNDDSNVKSAKEKAELLLQVLHNFDIKADLIDTHIGPSVTKYEIRPEPGVKVSKILNLADDIKMQLAVKDVRIEAPIPGHNAVGIEIPNVKATPVKMKELVNKIDEKEKNQPLLIFLGKDLLGNCITCRLDKMPHLLIAGATGSGKSVCMNAIITSLLLRTKPDEVKMLLIDPKKVEFTPYKKVPHLIGPVINDAQQASNALKVIVRIMEERYNLFAKASVRNIQAYNTKVSEDTSENKPKPLPYIVVIIDELADLMMVAGKDVEGSIQRITQLARAAGIHLIVATQRPSTDVITGIIKANIPSRIAFSVSSGIDSRTILDHTGAERLLGNGDMLYLPTGESSAMRIQGVFVTDGEVERITEDVSSKAYPMYDDAFVRLEGIDGNEDTAVVGAEEDPLYKEVKDYVINVQKASTSLLQRRFGIGYNRAARMIDLLEQQNVIGPAQGSKPREVYIKREDIEE